MKINNNKSGFTLLEIIIVIIIVGVLASLALPRFFDTVEFSRSSEAMNAMGVIKRSAERCTLMRSVQNDFRNCDTWAQIGLSDPGLATNAHFTYLMTGANGRITITATRNAVDGGDGTSTVRLLYNPAAGTTTRSGTGDFSSIN